MPNKDTQDVSFTTGSAVGDQSLSFTSSAPSEIPQVFNSSIPVKTTSPDYQLRHNISDEELEMLGQMRNIRTGEAFWTSLGVGLSLMPSFVSNIHDAYFADPVRPISVLGLFEIVLCAGGLLVALMLWVVGRMVGKNQDDIVAKIRARTAR